MLQNPTDPWNQALQKAARLLIASDFDGTLSEIVPNPAAARPVPGALATLQALAAHPGVRVALVSGRALADLRQRCPVPGCWYLGGHGNEWLGPNGEAQPESPAESSAGDPLSSQLQQLAVEARQRIRHWPGAELEVKPASVAIHYRNAPHLADQIERFATEQAAESFRLVSGKCIVELLPLTARHKGHGVQSLRQSLGCDFALYLGDDTTDEDVFRLHDPAILGIHVGHPSRPDGVWDTRPTAASAWLGSTAEVVATLRLIHHARLPFNLPHPSKVRPG